MSVRFKDDVGLLATSIGFFFFFFLNRGRERGSMLSRREREMKQFFFSFLVLLLLFSLHGAQPNEHKQASKKTHGAIVRIIVARAHGMSTCFFRLVGTFLKKKS